MKNQLVKYQVGDNEITLSDGLIRDHIAKNQKVTDQECFDFMALCKAQHLNPFIREAYLIKYGDNPATIVTGKDVFTKRAQADPDFDGMSAGIIFTKDGVIDEREGSVLFSDETLLGGWCRVWRKSQSHPSYDSVSFMEYAGHKKDGTLSGQWVKMPATMIRKVAMVHALREAFPEQLQGLYDASEMSTVDMALPAEPIEVAVVDCVTIDDAPKDDKSEAVDTSIEPDNKSALSAIADRLAARKGITHAAATKDIVSHIGRFQDTETYVSMASGWVDAQITMLDAHQDDALSDTPIEAF